VFECRAGTKNPAAGTLQSAGRFKIRVTELLEYAQHDRTDKGESDIRCDNAQSAHESHGKPPWFTSLPVVTFKASKPFQTEKVSAAVARGILPAGGVVKES
jgi:hypothetical protein